MNWFQVAVLAVIQGMAELLPVSSSAHVVVAEKLMGLDPSSPEMTFLLVALHTGTTFAVLLYFWPRWKERWVSSGAAARGAQLKALAIATVCTGVVGLVLKKLIEKTLLRGAPHAEIEALFSNMPLVAGALAAAGVLIIAAGRCDGGNKDIDERGSAWIGAVQGLCLPFRGFSRSGATISSALIFGVSRALAEDFSFALAVILTPPVVAREGLRLVKAAGGFGFLTPSLFMPGLLGMVFSFIAGLGALRWLSSWLEKGRWAYFGYYCLAASAALAAAVCLRAL
jgi:undecaprenyl-diphosphatase